MSTNNINVETFLANVGGMYGWDAAKVTRLEAFLKQKGVYPRASSLQLANACGEFQDSENPKPPEEQTPDQH